MWYRENVKLTKKLIFLRQFSLQWGNHKAITKTEVKICLKKYNTAYSWSRIRKNRLWAQQPEDSINQWHLHMGILETPWGQAQSYECAFYTVRIQSVSSEIDKIWQDMKPEGYESWLQKVLNVILMYLNFILQAAQALKTMRNGRNVNWLRF